MRGRLGQQATRIPALKREAPGGRLQRSENGHAEEAKSRGGLKLSIDQDGKTRALGGTLLDLPPQEVVTYGDFINSAYIYHIVRSKSARVQSMLQLSYSEKEIFGGWEILVASLACDS